MKLQEFLIASIIPWLFVLLLVLYYHVFTAPDQHNQHHQLDFHTKDRMNIKSSRQRASDVFDEMSKTTTFVNHNTEQSHQPEEVNKKVEEFVSQRPVAVKKEPAAANKIPVSISNDVDDEMKKLIAKDNQQEQEPEHQHQEESSKEISSQQSQPRYVYLDWSWDSDLVSYYNYKSIESFLACCYTPNTRIEVMILGSRVADYYKVVKVLR